MTSSADRVLFRCEYWVEDSGLKVDYEWALNSAELEDLYKGEDGINLYKYQVASAHEVEAWLCGFDEGALYGVAKARLKNVTDSDNN